MDALVAFYSQHPMWVWLAIAAVLLAIEVATGSGWLLPAAASAAAVGVLTLVYPLGFAGESILFAVLAVASTFLSRRFLKPRHANDTDEDVNDQRLRLVGRSGEAVQDFVDGRGRVFVDGSEWSAEAEPSSRLTAGARVEVTGLASGARLVVRAG
jgi:membrane protein implicated in regulation of membrane protease activity